MSICRIHVVLWSFVVSVLVMPFCSCDRISICLVKIGNTGMSSVCQGSNVLQCDEKQNIRISSTKLHRHSVNGENDCSNCDINTSKELDDNKNNMKIQHELLTRCSYTSNCTLTTNFTTLHEIRGKLMWYIDVNYSCVDQGDIYDMCSVWHEYVTTKALYISNHGYKVNRMPRTSSIHSCYCMFHGNVNITLVDYTPCSYTCQANITKVHINEHQHYDCGINCNNMVYFNELVPSTPPITNITFTSNGQNQDLFWISVQKSREGTPEGTPFVNCNENNTFVIPTSTTVVPVTPSEPPQHTTSTQCPPGSSNTEIIQEQSSISTSKGKLDTTEQPEAEAFPLVSVLVGVFSSIVVIIIIIIVVFLVQRVGARKRIRRNSNKYNTVQFKSKNMKAEIFKGIVNESYVDSNGVSYADRGQQNEIEENYSDPIDSVDDCGIRKEDSQHNPSESMGVYVNVGEAVQKHQMFDVDVSSNAEPYPIQSVDDSYLTLNNAPQRCHGGSSTYDTFVDNCEYSHIHATETNHMAPTSGIYSHLNHSVMCAPKTVDVDHGNSSYNHITLNAGNQTSQIERSDAGNYYNIENFAHDSCS